LLFFFHILSPATMLPILQVTALPLLFFATYVNAYPYPAGTSDSLLHVRQVNATSDCNATCSSFAVIEQQCDVPHCGCKPTFLQAQGSCLLCQTDTPQDAADVQFLLDTEIIQCHSEGVQVEFQLNLEPAAAAIVKSFYEQSAELRREQVAFLALQIAGGHVGLVLLLFLGGFSRKARRDAMFFNFCITWIFSSMFFSLLLYRGTEGNTTVNSLGDVSPEFCVAQAALTSGVQVMTAFSTMALVIQLWLDLRAGIYGELDRRSKQTRWTLGALLVAPYVLFLVFALPAVFLGQQNIVVQETTFEKAIPTNFYCIVVEKTVFLPAVYGVTLGLLIVTVVFDTLIMRILYRHWWALRNIRAKGSVSLSTLIRVMAFSFYRVVVAFAYGTILRQPPTLAQTGEGDTLVIEFGVPAWVDMLQAAIPLVAFLVLGVNQDMITTLTSWRKKRAMDRPSVLKSEDF